MPAGKRKREMVQKMGQETPTDAGMDHMREEVSEKEDIWP
jgi:hypothetical protein